MIRPGWYSPDALGHDAARDDARFTDVFGHDVDHARPLFKRRAADSGATARPRGDVAGSLSAPGGGELPSSAPSSGAEPPSDSGGASGSRRDAA